VVSVYLTLEEISHSFGSLQEAIGIARSWLKLKYGTMQLFLDEFLVMLSPHEFLNKL